MSKPRLEEAPDLGVDKAVRPNVNSIRFGDGYEQRVGSGMNRTPRTWKPTFTGAFPRISAIEAFLEERGGLESFEWADPHGNTGYYVCEDWSMKQIKFGVYQLSATFRQVYEF